MTWTSAIEYERLKREGKSVVRLDGKQIALFAAGDAVHACNNRCPHEGYPLREGTLDGDCVLTCNWHGWKFDLRSGENLFQGDRLRIYPTKIEGGTVWVDVADPPAAERQARARSNLRTAFDDHEYDRIAREVARLQKAGADPVEAVAAAIEWSHARLRFGMTHAYAAAAGWLTLLDRSNDPEVRLSCLTEAVGHMAWDALREPERPFRDEVASFSVEALADALERQDEGQAVAQLRGAWREGLNFADLERALSAAALRHYADFGHSLIYVVHVGELIGRLGHRVEAPLLLALVRSLTNASREDLIPEFRGYAAALADWPKANGGTGKVAPGDLIDRSIKGTMAAVVERAFHVPKGELHHALLAAAGLNLLRYDASYQARTDNGVADNIGWLDFTHGITFGSAVRRQCRKFPELWPQGLLQMACFVGRNSGYVDKGISVESWRIRDRQFFASDCVARILDHAEPDYIHSAHLLKTYLAAEAELDAGLPAPLDMAVMAGVSRYMRANLKRKHVRRTAHQALEFVALED